MCYLIYSVLNWLPDFKQKKMPKLLIMLSNNQHSIMAMQDQYLAVIMGNKDLEKETTPGIENDQKIDLKIRRAMYV
jgi:hypothetical protein